MPWREVPLHSWKESRRGAIWTLARKEFWLLLRDRVATVLLLGMPLLFVLGLLLGEGFGQKTDERLRISLSSTSAHGAPAAALAIPRESV